MAKINLSGFSGIHVARMVTEDTVSQKPTYEALVPLQGGKSIEVSLNYEGVKFYADNTISYQDNYFTGGEVTLSLSGLTMEEYSLLFGNTIGKHGVTGVNANDVAPTVAITFEKKILGTNHKRLFVLYGVNLAPSAISAETLADSVSESPIEITGQVRQLVDGSIYAMVDTNSAEYNAELDNWHEEVKFMEAKELVLSKASK